MQELPNPVAPDAPSPDDFEPGESVHATHRGQIAFDHDGARYCAECVNPGYADVCLEDPRQIPYGGPVPDGAEGYCPGYGCDHCHRRIEGFTLIHGGVCDPDSCPVSTHCDQCGDAIFHDEPATDVLGGSIVCRNCAKKAGVDVGAFCRPFRRVLDG